MELTFGTFKDHAQSKSMWLGSHEISELKIWAPRRTESGIVFEQTVIQASEALLKVFDEILVNAIDQYVKSPKFTPEDGGAVTRIDVSMDAGEITVTNDGPGIPVYFVESIKQWSVQAVISREFSGSNLDENPDQVTGGINGLGIKLININSKRFEIQTADKIRKKLYTQVCENNMDTIHPPVIKDYTGKPFTTIKFIPDYAGLCQITKHSRNPEWLRPENIDSLSGYIAFRVYQTAAFISCINYRYEGATKLEYRKKARISFQGETIQIKNLSDYCRMFGITEMVEFEAQRDEEHIRFPWTVCVGYANSTQLAGIRISIINGIFLSKGGSHVNMLFNQLKASLKPHIDSITKDSSVEFKDSMLQKMLFTIDVRQIPLPQFAGQVKESITISTKDLNKMKQLYCIPDAVSSRIWKMLRDAFEYKINQQDIKNSTKKSKVDKTRIRKYERADRLGPKSGLFIPEGDSAALPVQSILTSKTSKASRRNYGTYNIQGVPPNACKKSKEIMIDGEKKIKQDRGLQRNIAFQGLVRVLGLDYSYSYYAGPDLEKRRTGDKEFATLNYGHIIIATDQDLDGIGNICSLIIVFILTFWPELIKRGFVRRIQTPLIRIYTGKSDVLEFYSARDYHTWVQGEYGVEDNIPDRVKKGINYYKGLSGHSPEEVENMGENIQNNIITLTWDDVIRDKMRLFYGADTEERKESLLTPVTVEYTRDMLRNQSIPVSMHFEVESKAFQLYFMRRKLKSAIDGMIPSQRKAFAGARIMFRTVDKAKVYQITGHITKEMHYQHGDMSMNDTIIKMAQNFTGSNNIPAFIPISIGFGSRVGGRGHSASPRYIETKYNSKVMNLIFPPEDDWLLNYVYEDGVQSEPEYYVPIIPYSILETTTTVGVGWNISVWARDYKWTMHLLRNMIQSDYPNRNVDLPDGTSVVAGTPYGFLGKVWIPQGMRIKIGRTQYGRHVTEICTGTYEVDEDTNTIRVLQLPLKIWSEHFKCKLLGMDPKTGKTEDSFGEPLPSKPLVEEVLDYTGNDENNIIIKLKPGALKQIHDYGSSELDPVEDYLEMYQLMNPALNMFVADGSIKEFRSYEEVMQHWFVVRKDMYKRRIERELVLLRFRILYFKSILRFIEMDDKKEINIDRKKKEDRIRILEAAGFARFNRTNLLTPRYIKTDELEAFITQHGANYDYIDSINKGMTEEASVRTLEEKIRSLEAKLAELSEASWQQIWLTELDHLDTVIQEGIRTKWLFKIKQHKFRSVK